MDRLTEADYQRAYRKAIIIWALMVMIAAAIMIVGGLLVEPDEHGMAFFDPYMAAILPAALALFAPVVTLFFKTTAKGCFVCILQLALTIAAAQGAIWALREIEFDRTPPCWGIHSIDPGSGAGCPPGMKEDFTPEQLREWYRKERQISRP